MIVNNQIFNKPFWSLYCLLRKQSSLHPGEYFTDCQFQSFSTNRLPTMEFKDRRLDFLADSATGLMFYDIQDIIDGYDCTGNQCTTKNLCYFVYVDVSVVRLSSCKSKMINTQESR